MVVAKTLRRTLMAYPGGSPGGPPDGAALPVGCRGAWFELAMPGAHRSLAI